MLNFKSNANSCLVFLTQSNADVKKPIFIFEHTLKLKTLNAGFENLVHTNNSESKIHSSISILHHELVTISISRIIHIKSRA